MMKRCEWCKHNFVAKDYRDRFCCRSHAASYNNSQRGPYKSRKCLYEFCDNRIQHSSTSIYCAVEHRQEDLKWKYFHAGWYPTSKQMPRWLRDFLIVLGCSVCGWNEINPISNRPQCQIDHIDGNCFNHKKENIRVLCPNHHSLTNTFGTLNKKYKK